MAHKLLRFQPVAKSSFRNRFQLESRESPIQGHSSGDESSGRLYEASGAWRNTAQRLGKYGRGMDPCAKIGRPAHGYMSQREWIEMYQ